MPLNNAAMLVGANAIRAAITHLQLHSGDPGSAGTSNVTSAARQPVSWSSVTNDGDFGLSASVAFTGVAANGATTYVSAWSALTGGTWYGSFQLFGTLTADASGNYTLTALNLNGVTT
jgi:hypothetical protein